MVDRERFFLSLEWIPESKGLVYAVKWREWGRHVIDPLGQTTSVETFDPRCSEI